MPSILPNYEYDVFISYRQNDNKRDGWVSNFVAALKDELEATLKNPVSIYFDENPHDGLLETDQVGATLEKKLKCIVFIPIISQTYCDTSSFAWEHEFIPFIKLATEDELGMNITLANGNVTSRVLPVQIHDLDGQDKAVLAQELGGPLRSIDFIYKEAGVNRPLKPNDVRILNLAKTDYHNQINKVANALKEIGMGVVKNSDMPATGASLPGDKLPDSNGGKKPGTAMKMILGSILIPILFALLYYLYTALTDKERTVEVTEKSLAIMPFTDMSPNKDQEWFSAGLTEELNNSLANVPDLTVRARTSSAYLRGQNLSLQKIADSLNVKYVLQGSVRKMGDKLKISTQLIEAQSGTNMWSNTYDRTMSDIFNIQQDISENIAKALNILLDEGKRSRMYSIGTRNVEAYEEYLNGNVYYKLAHIYSPTDSSLYKANKHYEKAIALDPNFPQPYARHQDYYSHYFIDGRHGIYNYTMDGLTDSDISKIISVDLDMAIKNSSQPIFRLAYQLDKIFLSDNWQGAVPLIESFLQMDDVEKEVIRNDFSWFTHLFSYAAPGSLSTPYLERINNDPYDFTAYNLFLSSLIRMNLLDSAASYYDNNEIYMQDLPNLANKRAAIALVKGNVNKAYNVMERAFLNQEKDIEDFSAYYVLSKSLVSDKQGLPELQPYLDNIDLDALPFYNISGQYERADSLARAFDAKYLGPCIISRFLFGNPLLFHLSATPNFSARLRELGVDVVKYEKEHYIKLPVTSITGL